jgi:hypothetical protein
MFATLTKWLSSAKVTSRSRREHRCRSVRPALEALEDRQLLSAFPVVNSMVNEDFVLYSNGHLQKIDHTQVIFPKTTIDQSVRANSLSVGTDASGRGMAAYISAVDGQAYEWDDTNQQVQSLFNSAVGVTNNIKAVAAGQGGCIFVLTTGNHLAEFDMAHQQWTNVGDNIAAVSASASRVEPLLFFFSSSTMADVVKTDGTAWEWSQVSFFGANLYNELTPLTSSTLGITNNVKSVSRAPTGASFVLLTSGVLFEYDPSANTWNNLGGNIASVSAGTDAAGKAMASVIDLNGVCWSWSTTHPYDAVHGYYQELFVPGNLVPIRPTNGFPTYGFPTHPTAWPPLRGVVSFSAGSNGIADVVLSDGSLYRYNDVTRQWTFLDSGVA